MGTRRTSAILLGLTQLIGWAAFAGEAVTELAPADLKRVDTLIERFLAKHHVAGLSMAIAKDGRLVFAKGYGYADAENKVKVTTSSLFRIASVSKPITSVAIFTLVEQHKLSLDDKVFGKTGILGEDFGLPMGFPGRGDMTVTHLLEHTGGGWASGDSDPNSKRRELPEDEFIRWVLANIELQHRPGSVYAYSNFGYSLLGKVIEKQTGQSYEDFVRSNVLSGVGASNMYLGGDLRSQRRPEEVVYYPDADGSSPYGIEMWRKGAHGGWIASAVDLLRFLVRVDGFPTKPDILGRATIAKMTRPSFVNPNYAKGWRVNSEKNWWHGGVLPGTFAFVVRSHSGFCWSILMNQRQSTRAFEVDVDQLGWEILGQVKSWPPYDLF